MKQKQTEKSFVTNYPEPAKTSSHISSEAKLVIETNIEPVVTKPVANKNIAVRESPKVGALEKIRKEVASRHQSNTNCKRTKRRRNIHCMGAIH
ncbi:MAG: hypothetical protein WKF59_05560 [Chitinophagaceae bacterium]